MATERARVGLAALGLPVVLLVGLPVSAHAATAWWEPLAFSGQRVTAVSADGGRVIAATAGGTYVSASAGQPFLPVDPANPPSPRAQPDSAVWEIHAGSVFTGQPGQGLHVDPQAPFLGAGAHLIAAPATLPGVVVAVGTDNHVWRRAASGQWATSFVLLPAGGLSGAPVVTALAAFMQPLSNAVYMGTDGYGVLVSEDGGDDWIRADPGLPETVLGLAADPGSRALYAATDGGLYVHQLQALPAPPVYHDASLYLRWLGIGMVALLATVAAVLGLRRVLPTG